MTNNLMLVPFPLGWVSVDPINMSFEVKIFRMTHGVGKQVGVASVVLKNHAKLLSANTTTLACTPEVIYFEEGVSVTDEDLHKKCEIKAMEIWGRK